MAPTQTLVKLTHLAFGLIATAFAYELQTNLSQSECRCFPGDKCWPTQAEWSQFNKTVGGKLIATTPIASACHRDPFAAYNADECAALQSNWGFPEVHYETSSSVMSAYFANQSCDPFTATSAQCVIGTYVQYAVNASCASDYQETIKFAQERNIRLVIRNTGHDFFGKSTGAGGLAIWTHHLKDLEIKDYSSPSYTGKAIKIGAGVQSFEAQQAAHDQGYVTVSGNCPTIGLAGGYTQGGGHSPLSSRYGLAADQVLEWEVVTGTGELLTATPTENSDLYFALTGGGGGTYGVVLGMTARLHKDSQVTSANLTFTSDGTTQEKFYDAVQTWIVSLPNIVDAGAVAVWWLTNTTFSMEPTTAPGVSKAQLEALLQPILSKLDSSSIPYVYNIREFDSYLEANAAMNPQGNVTEISLGGRLLPRSLLATNNSIASVRSATEFITSKGAMVSGITINVGQNQTRPANAVHPAWRDAFINFVIGVPWSRTDWEGNLEGLKLITDELQPRLDELDPSGGSYLNEADINQPDWKKTFFGPNYAKLRAIKAKYDPENTFYALKAVGSDYWVEQSDGRLCKAT